ncbi:DoxX family protein [Spirosoma terrae]|uniref:DoxX family protein n=1 Tax=Spirosoma terrae TaxID=1968276 RepID=A0A6L9LGA3_9BACT|nr:DoxX family protein [Spirosoma terrae]NDU98697.1 DoxX family protein [Spirosoma terrae]
MENQRISSNVVHIVLWVVQVILAVSLIWAAWMKLVQPIEQLATMWPWAGQVPVALVKMTGIVDLLGAAGLILPSVLRIQPKLTPMAAISIIILMVCASVFHIMRGEVALIGVNIVFAILAAFVAWGRLTKAPIMPSRNG